jgi:signal transduction histidine kinase
VSWLANLSIRRKLFAIVAATCAVALLLANGALLAWDFMSYREDLRDDLHSAAAIVGSNSTAAIKFADPDTAAELLSSLAAQSHVTWAAIYDDDRQLFARYVRTRAAPPPRRPPVDGARFVDGDIEVTEPIVLHGARVGTIAVRGSLEVLYGRMWRRAGTVTLLMILAGLFAVLMTRRLQRLVSEPLLQLTHVARAVTANQNYSLRATAASRDEIGLLVDAFNDMLAQIERRDAELLAAKQMLEQRVEERTAQLQEELSVRLQAERELAQRNAELEQTNQQLDDFAYIASHDLKEPLRGIHNYAQFLVEDYGGTLDEEGQNKLHTLIRLSRRMETLIDSLLHYSRLGRSELTVTPVDLNELLSEVRDTLAWVLKERHVDIRVPRPLPVIRADRDRIGEVLANLISNAAKYNDKTRPWVEIGTAEPQNDPHELTLYVRDNGIGIAERHVETVFRIFKRLHGRDEFGGGTGAGLTIVRKIVEQHRGRAWIASVPGVGTTVFFTLSREL